MSGPSSSFTSESGSSRKAFTCSCSLHTHNVHRRGERQRVCDTSGGVIWQAEVTESYTILESLRGVKNKKKHFALHLSMGVDIIHSKVLVNIHTKYKVPY